MRRGTPPVNPVLDLWSLGHSATTVAEMLDFPGGWRGVARLIEKARSIGDPRAVLHAGANGRLIGRPGHMRELPEAEVVPAISRYTHCKRGHALTPENREGKKRRCVQCRRAYDEGRRR
jgi:hypothetical protein